MLRRLFRSVFSIARYFVSLAVCLFSLPVPAAACARGLPSAGCVDAGGVLGGVQGTADAGHTEEKTIFSSVLLHEPEKQDVLDWKPGAPMERKADVVLYHKGHSYARAGEYLDAPRWNHSRS